MRKRALALILMATLTGACVRHAKTHVDGGVLGRVVIYRNGVAFYERHATMVDGRVAVQVPRDRVDDFLKSLTVVDAITKRPIAVTIPRKEADDGSYLTMTLEAAAPAARAEVLLTYVTESPAWKPSYRVVVGKEGRVMLEGWAIVDNMTSEDWRGVLVGVGASSALAFRYDLWSVRQVDRDLLADEERFASAPPSGVSPYDAGQGAEELATLDGEQVRGDAKPGEAKPADTGVTLTGTTSNENTYIADGVAAADRGAIQGTLTDKRSGEKLVGVTVVASTKNGAPQTAITDENGHYKIANLPPGDYTVTFYYLELTVERSGVRVAKAKTTPVFQKLDSSSVSRGEAIVVTSSAPTIDTTNATGQRTTLDRNYQGDIPGRSFRATMKSSGGSTYEAPKPPPPIQLGDEKLKAIAGKVVKERRDVVVEVHARDVTTANARGAAVKNKLVDDGVPASRVHVVPRVGADEQDDIRVLAVAPGDKPPTAPPAPRTHTVDTPVGESHFMADRPMTVRAGSSAMVAMVRSETTGGVVYFYDPISERGDARYAFKAIRLDNPTNDTLESGPVTVYGDGRFIGEGITEPVPPKASVVVPFALDRQIVVERTADESDRIAKLVTVQRGVVTAEVQHRRTTKLTLTSRLATPTVVYLRHRLESGWSLVDAPSTFMKVGDSQLFSVPLEPGATKHVTIAEATPVQKTFELASEAALGMMKVFVDDPAASPALKAQIAALLATHGRAADLVDKIATLRDQLGEYRDRAIDLEGQLVSLRNIRSSTELASGIRSKLAEMNDRMQKTTLAIVDAKEKLMLARVTFQNQLAELRLDDATAVTKR